MLTQRAIFTYNVGIHTCIYICTMNSSVFYAWDESSTLGLLGFCGFPPPIFAANSDHLSLIVENLASIIQRPLFAQF